MNNNFAVYCPLTPEVIPILIYLQMIDDPRDRSTFERVYHRYRALMFHVARRLLPNDADAEDAVHEAFLSIAKNIQKISDPDTHKTRAYVVIIVERKAIDMLRAAGRRPTADWDERYLGASQDPEPNAALAAMRRLPRRQQELLYLKHFCGYHSREIAEMLDMSDDMVRRTLSDARNALRKEWEKEVAENEA